MKIVIDIDREVYNFIKNRGHLPYAVDISNEIANGTVLPERHGDLIDRNTVQMCAEKFHSLGDLHMAQWVVDNAPTVIPTDK